MESLYDVIVVGAGNGGLVAAGTTAKNGYKTLLLEKNNVPGGCATSFSRGRFEFEPSLHELSGVGVPGNREYVYDILNGLGAEVDWRYEKNMFRAIVTGPDGYDVTVRSGIKGFCESVDEVVPGSYKKVMKLFKLAMHDAKALDYITRKKGKPNKLWMAMRYGNFMRAASHTVEEVEIALGIPEKARNIVNTYWCYLGVPTDELNCMHYLNMLRSYVQFGAAMPAKRSHEISEALVKAIRSYGGEVWFNSKVTGFLSDESGRVTGVEVNGKKIYAREVISNIIPNNVFNMMDSAVVPQTDLKLANSREFGVSVMTIYLGLDCTREELGINDYTTFIMNNQNPRVQHDTNGLYIVNCLNTVIPESSPKGTCTLFFTTLCYGKDFPKDVKPEDYKKYKNQIAEKYISEYEKLIGKDIHSHIEEISVATPATFARYLDTPDGTIYGYKLSGWDNLMSRVAHEAKEYTIPGLSFVGGHHIRGDGYCSAYYTGSFIGSRVVRKLKAADEAKKENAAGEAVK